MPFLNREGFIFSYDAEKPDFMSDVRYILDVLSPSFCQGSPAIMIGYYRHSSDRPIPSEVDALCREHGFYGTFVTSLEKGENLYDALLSFLRVVLTFMHGNRNELDSDDDDYLIPLERKKSCVCQ